MKKQLLQHTEKLFALGDQLMVSGTSFITGILITRAIGVEGYGTFALYWMVYLFLQGFSNAYIGLPAQIISSKHDDAAAYLEKNNRLGIVVVTLLIPLLYAGFFIYDQVANAAFGWGYWLFPLIIVLYLKQEMNRKYFYAKQATKKVVVIDAITYLLQLPIMAIWLFIGYIDLNVILGIMLSTSFVGQIAFLVLKDDEKSASKWEDLPFWENWEYARYLITTSILQWFSGNILLAVAGSVIGVGAVGVVRILQNIMGVLHVLFLTLENVVPVKAAFLLHNHSKIHMFTYLKKVAVITGIFYGILLLILSIFGESVLTLLYGQEYAHYTDLLHLFIGVYVLIFLGTLAQILIKTLQLNHGIFLAYVCSAIAALLLAHPLLNLFGVKGIIIGFGVLQLITITVYTITIKQKAL